MLIKKKKRKKEKKNMSWPTGVNKKDLSHTSGSYRPTALTVDGK
jgi:hypothetical protein